MQKKVGDALYVLDLTPYVITEDTDVSIIYVQNEKMKEYKELNTELASKMHGFNQFIMTVLPRPWAEDGGGEPGQTGHTLTITINNLPAHFGVCGRVDANNQPSIEGNTTWLTTEDGFDEQGHETKVINNLPAGYHFQIDERLFTAGFNFNSNPVLETVIDDGLWGVGTTYVMPDSDVNITLSAQGHSLRITGNALDHVDIYFNGTQVESKNFYLTVPIGTAIKIEPKVGTTKEWFNNIKGVEWDDNVQAWVIDMPDFNYTIRIYYTQPAAKAYWGYTDVHGTQLKWEQQYFVKSPRVFLADTDQDHVSTSQWLYPVDENGNTIPINSAETDGLTVSSITSSNPLVTFDSSNGMPIVSRDSNGELPYDVEVDITATIHDNSGAYRDAEIYYTLVLSKTFKLTIDAYHNPDTGNIDDRSVSSSSDYISGNYNGVGVEEHNMIRYMSSETDYGPTPYVVDWVELHEVGLPSQAAVSLWFDGLTRDINTVYSTDSGEEISDSKPELDHWIYLTMPESNVTMSAYWNTDSINKVVFNDTVASHNGSNIDENGNRYYYIKYYQTAPDTYTNELTYGYNNAAERQYGPSDFTFHVSNAQGQSVELTDQGAGSYSFSMNSNNTPDTFTITVSDPS